MRVDSLERRQKTPKKRLGAEQIVTKLQQVELLHSQGKSVAVACKETGLTEKRCNRHPKECSGLNVKRPRKLKQLEPKNGRAIAEQKGQLQGPLNNCP